MPNKKPREGTRKHSQSVVRVMESRENQKIEHLSRLLQKLSDNKKKFVESKKETVTHMKENSPEDLETVEDFNVEDFNIYIRLVRKELKKRRGIMSEYEGMKAVLFPFDSGDGHDEVVVVVEEEGKEEEEE